MRQIVLDTETTGLDSTKGHRIIEIACVEMIDRRLTGDHLHFYINPQREIDAGALQVHGLSNEFLSQKPLFRDIANEFLEYVRGAELIIHNAPFDLGFINQEFKLLRKGLGKLENYCSVMDTLVFARKKHPGQRNSLDALCSRYKIDNSMRDLHGALLDSQILALVYLALTSEQFSLFADQDEGAVLQEPSVAQKTDLGAGREALKVIQASEEELAQHAKRLEDITKVSGESLWD